MALKLRVHDAPVGVPQKRADLVAVSSKFGLVFVGTPTGEGAGVGGWSDPWGGGGAH